MQHPYTLPEMKEDELYINLRNAYSDENLNTLSARIIEFYKTRQYSRIRDLVKILSEYVNLEDEKMSKAFSKIIMLYHPDKGSFYRSEIENLYLKKDFTSLSQFSHILLVQNLEELPVTIDEDDIDYHPQYVWDMEDQEEEFTENEFDNEDNYGREGGFDDEQHNFYNALKRKIYGGLKVDLPSYYLEDLEEMDMAEYEIESLDGIEFCRQLVNIDLSRNQISDISNLWTLQLLEEVYLADNNIGYIDALCNLNNLRVVDLSNNMIDDISPLFDLDKLEYVNIIGNKIPITQIEQLKAMNVMVVY